MYTIIINKDGTVEIRNQGCDLVVFGLMDIMGFSLEQIITKFEQTLQFSKDWYAETLYPEEK